MTDEQPIVRWYTVTDVGLVRKQNEDFVQAVPDPAEQSAVEPGEGRLCVVADGMGGHYGGAVASQIAARRTIYHFYGASVPALRERLLNAMAAAGKDIAAAAAEDRKLLRMGTTIVAAAVAGEHAVVANVGDSRAYHYRRGVMELLSTDDRWVLEQVRDGLLSAEHARTHPQRNILTQYLGAADDAVPHVREVLLRPGDRLLLCSDGLHELVSDQELQYALQQPPPRAIKHLLALALKRGATDNVTVAIGAYDRPVRRNYRAIGAAAVGLAAALAIGFQIGNLLRLTAPTAETIQPRENTVLAAPLPTERRETATPDPTVASRRRATAEAQTVVGAASQPQLTALQLTPTPFPPTTTAIDFPSATLSTTAETAVTQPVPPTAAPVSPPGWTLTAADLTTDASFAMNEDERAIFAGCINGVLPRLILSVDPPQPVVLEFRFSGLTSAQLPAGSSVRPRGDTQCFPLDRPGTIVVDVYSCPSGVCDLTPLASTTATFERDRIYLLRVTPP